jgi:microcystin-dependent protein
MDVFMGYIAAFGFNYAPKGWVFCDGRLMAIAQNSALFSLLGTTYGGDGRTTFGIPDLRCRTLVGMGNGPGLTGVVQGEKAGSQQVTILQSNMPQHNHTLNAVKLNVFNGTGIEASPVGNFPSNITGGYSDSSNGVSGNAISGTTDIVGGSQSINIMNPYLGINYSIATVGIFPSRN